jgi:hypothetical protein
LYVLWLQPTKRPIAVSATAIPTTPRRAPTIRRYHRDLLFFARRPNRCSIRLPGVTPEELERLRRSVVMLPPGHSAGALTREAALAMLDELAAARQETVRYRQLVTQLRHLLATLDP